MDDGLPGETDAFFAVMRQTRARFVEGFTGRLEDMRRLASAAGPSDLDELKRVAHQIAGLAGTLGFGGAGIEAAALEARVDAAIVRGARGDAALLTTIDRLGEIFQAESRQPPPWER